MATTQVCRSERFPDLADEVLFPRLSDAKLAWLSKRGPCTEAARGVLALDAAGYLLCGSAAAGCDGHLSWPLKDPEPHLLETVRPGVFTAGDVRAGATNRVAGAVGDGALAVRFAHDVLAG
jgi:thioredoxin reductase (NADPH)